MKRWKKVTLVIVLLIITGGLAYAYYVWNKPQRDVSDEKGIVITAPAIFDSFVNNEAAANKAFLNKAIEVTGTVTGVKKNQAGKTVVYLQSSDPMFGVNCTFKQDPGNIEKGSQITFKGICTGYLSDVVLNDGIIINQK